MLKLVSEDNYIKYYFMYFSEYYLLFNLNALINKCVLWNLRNEFIIVKYRRVSVWVPKLFSQVQYFTASESGGGRGEGVSFNGWL